MITAISISILYSIAHLKTLLHAMFWRDILPDMDKFEQAPTVKVILRDTEAVAMAGMALGLTFGATGYSLSRITMEPTVTREASAPLPLPAVHPNIGLRNFNDVDFANTTIGSGIIGALALTAVFAYKSHPMQALKGYRVKRKEVKLLKELYALPEYQREDN
jgi:hypothetical protein